MAKKLRSIKLQAIGDVNRLVAMTINELRRDEIDGSKATKIGYLCNILIGSFRSYEIERRLNELADELKLINEQKKLRLVNRS